MHDQIDTTLEGTVIKHWIVVADADKANIYATDELLEKPEVALKLHMSHGKVHAEDAQGAHSTAHLPGAGGDAAHASPHDAAEDKFARAVALAMVGAFKQHSFQRAVLVAPPTFLGDVRRYLDTPTSKAVVASIHHDWTHMKGRDLFDRVRKELPADAGLH